MAKKIEYTTEQIEQIIKMNDDGFLQKEIAEHFNVSKSSIGRVLKKANIPSKHPWLNEERELLACDTYRELQNLKLTGKKIKMSPATIKEILIKYDIETLDISKVHLKYNIDDSYFEKIDSHRKAYFLGFLYADGYLNVKNHSITLSLQEQDKYILESLKEELKSDKPLYFIDYKSKNVNFNNQFSLNITNKKICRDLMNLGLTQNKSLVLEFPTCISEEYYSSFILGYMDGDGHIAKNIKEKRCSLVSTENFCLKIKEILKDQLNINCSILYCHGNKNTTTRVLQIAGNNQVKKYLDWLYSNCDLYLNRKHNVYLSNYCIA